MRRTLGEELRSQPAHLAPTCLSSLFLHLLPPNHFKWQEFTLSVSLKVFIRQRYKPDTPEVVMEVKRHFLVGPKLVERRCHSLLEGSHLFSDVTQIELCELPVLLLVINHRAMSSQKEARGKACFWSQFADEADISSLTWINPIKKRHSGGAMVKCEPALVPIRKRKYRGIHTNTYSLPKSNTNAKKLRQ